jgi:hypothetical protein
MKRRNDYGEPNVMMSHNINASEPTLNKPPSAQINVLPKSSYQEPQPQIQRQADPYQDMPKREYEYKAQGMPNIENFGNEIDYKYLEKFQEQPYVSEEVGKKFEDVRETNDERVGKEEPLADETMLRNYREQIERKYDKNVQADEEVRKIQRLHNEKYYEDPMPKDLQYEFPTSTKEAVADTFEPEPESELKPAPMEERRNSELRKSPAQQYKEELDRQIMLKQQLQKEAEKVSRSLDLKVLQRAKAEEDRLNKEKLEKKKRMQQIAKKEYEHQLQGRNYGRGYRGANVLGYKNSVQEPVAEEIETKKLPNVQDSFDSIHEANREEYKRVFISITS